MKRYFFLTGVLLIGIIVSCNTSKYYYRKGFYDQAIQKSVKKLMIKPTKEKEIAILHKSFVIANAKDNDRIQFLQSSGQPDIWDELFTIYTRLKNRQDMVKFLPQVILQRIVFQPVNYDNEIHNAKKKAAEYFYTLAQKHLSENNRNSAQQAYYEFLKVKTFFPEYRDVDELIRQSELKGTTNILFAVQNSTGLIIPEVFQQQMLQIPLTDLNQLFKKFYNNKVQNINFQYFINLNLKEINASPEQVKEIHYTDSKEVQDGFQYVLDNKGNVMKDSLGNDIKVPKMKTITCDIIENRRFKLVTVQGLIAVTNSSGQLLINEPVTAESVFENFFIVYKGDESAMSEETKRKLANKPLPFPPTENMILQTTEFLKGKTKDFVARNSYIFN